jgi:hypothetical protein
MKLVIKTSLHYDTWSEKHQTGDISDATTDKNLQYKSITFFCSIVIYCSFNDDISNSD